MKEQVLELILLGYGVASALLPFAVFLVLYSRGYSKNGVSLAKKEIFLRVIFALYICAVFVVTGIGTIYEIFRYKLAVADWELNLVPFHSGITIGMILNVIMFVPLGFMVPAVFKQCRSIAQITMCGFIFSLLIELSQLLNRRCTDIDDLLMNTLGAILGGLLYRVVCAIFSKKIKKAENTENQLYKAEPLVYIAVMLLGYFFMYNGIGAAVLLYGF